MQITTLVSGKPEQTIAEYTEAQKRRLFASELGVRVSGIEYLYQADCLQAARDATVIVQQLIDAELVRRETERRRQLEIDFGFSAEQAEFVA